MTGVVLKLEGEGQVSAALARLRQAVARPRATLDEIGNYLVNATRARFRAGKAPDGTPWQPSLRARLQGGQTLVDSGRLRGSITHRASDTEVVVGTGLRYGAVHQFGAVITGNPRLKFRLPDGQFRSPRQVKLPARPFLGLDRLDRERITDIIRSRLEQAQGGALS